MLEVKKWICPVFKQKDRKAPRQCQALLESVAWVT